MAGSDKVKYLLIGGGAAAAQASVGVREVDPEGSAMIVCSEPRMPYDRPPLSKGFLNFKPSNPEDIESKDTSFYVEKNIEVRTGTEALSIDRAAKQVQLSDGSTITYEKLLIATGSTPLNPPIKGANLKNVFLFRTVDDAETIRNLANDIQNVTLIGAGFIGMEVGASLKQRGKNVTIIDTAKYPYSKFVSPISGNYLRSAFENEGIRFIFEDEVDEIGGEGRAQVVRTKAGHAAPADVVVIGVGVALNNKLATDAGLTTHGKGAVGTNEYFQSDDDPDIFIAGDLAAFQDVLLGKRWHAEHYMHAKWSGKQAGRNMAGAGERFEKVAYFFSDMFDVSMVLRGDPQDVRASRVLGDVDTGEFVELYTRGDDTVRMGIGFTRDGDRYDPIVDGIEKVILDKRRAHDVQPADVGL